MSWMILKTIQVIGGGFKSDLNEKSSLEVKRPTEYINEDLKEHKVIKRANYFSPWAPKWNFPSL